MTDHIKLRQILLNLVSNALKFTPGGGEVRIEVEMRDQSVYLHVRDTGIGIDSEHLQRIFDPFWQVRYGDAPGGTGLGLAISKRFAELLGGDLEASSVPGIGSCFTLRLPFPPPPSTGTEHEVRST